MQIILLEDGAFFSYHNNLYKLLAVDEEGDNSRNLHLATKTASGSWDFLDKPVVHSIYPYEEVMEMDIIVVPTVSLERKK